MSDLLIEYRLKTVRVGVVVTLIVIGELAVYPFMSGHGEIHRGSYIALIVAASVGAVVIAALPWHRLFQTGAGVWLLYGWSAFDVVLITLAVAATGGGRSPLVFLWALTTVFAASSYPRNGQLAVLGFTCACLVAVVVVGDSGPGSAVVLLELVVLGCVTLLAAFLSGQLVERIAAEAATRVESERRAHLLAAVAAASRSIADLDPDVVLQRVVGCVADLGFSACNINLLDADEPVYRVPHSHGLPPEYVDAVHPNTIGMVGLVRERAATVVINDYAKNARGVPQLRQAGFKAVVAVPVRVEGRIAAVLVGGSLERHAIAPEEVEAVELLAAQAGVALTNAERFEAERAMVRRLAELDRLKQDFIATVSHELRTPLTVIHGLGKTLEQRWADLDDDLRQELLHRVNDNAAVLGGTIDTLLDFAQLEAGRLEARLVPFDLSASVTLATARLGSLFGARSLRVDIEPDCWVLGDQRLLERVVDNLLANAAKHTPDSAHVVVAVRTTADDAIVSVVDDGPGIAAADLAHLGERFFRGGDAHTRNTRGTGLGLAFGREVMALHGRPLDISSVPGRTEFSFRMARAAPPTLAPWDSSTGTERS
ncbi:MAG: Osmosensitive channel histidine kinase KdpD [Acidimicrobiales bacterium]|nr:Osmosensitive channel histidine kinase KdpD [Acidimicrobiales bacterium]